MANKKISELDSRATLGLSDLMVVGDPSTGYAYKTTLNDVKSLVGSGVNSFNGRIGAVVPAEGDYNLDQLGDVVITSPASGQVLKYNGSGWVNGTETYVGTVTSVAMSVPTGFAIGGSPITSAGTLALSFAAGYSLPTTVKQGEWDTAYNRSLTAAAVSGTTTKTLTLTKQDGTTLTASWSDLNTDAVTSVFGRTGAVVATEGDYTLDLLGDVSIATPSSGQLIRYNGTSWANWTPNYLTAESDTLDSVTARGNTTANGITAGSLTSTGLTVSVGAVFTNVGYHSNLNGNLRYTFDTNDLVLRAGTSTSNEYMRIFGADGNVGIGTSSNAGYKLDVAGGVRFGNIIVRDATYPGYTLTMAAIGNAYHRITGGYGNEWIEFGGPAGNSININSNELRLTSSVIVTQASATVQTVGTTGLNFNAVNLYQQGDTRYGVTFTAPMTSATASGVSELYLTRFNPSIATSVGQINAYVIAVQPVINTTAGTTVMRGFYYNPTVTGSTGLTNIAFESTAGIVKISDLAGSGTRMVVADANGVLTTQAIGSGSITGSGAAGQVSFFSGASAITGSNNLFWDSANNRLGIGTNAPSTLLHVYTTTANAGRIRVTSTTSTAGNYRGYEFGNSSGFRGGLVQDESTEEISIFTPVGGNSVRISSVGNVGVAVSPSAWGSSFRNALQVNNASLAGSSGSASYMSLMANAFLNSSAQYVYISSNFASRYEQVVGSHAWYTSASGTAGNVITWSQPMTLTASGRLLLGTTTEGTFMLDVNGTARVSGAATFLSSVTLSSTASSFVVLDNTTATTGRQWRVSSASNGRFFLTNVTDAVDVLTIQTTGAATFSSTLTATQYTAQSDSAYYRIRRAAGTDVGYITDSTTWGHTGTDFSIGASSANLRFYTNNSTTERMRLDASGNLGLGVVPSAWSSGFRALQIGLSTSLYNNATTNGMFLGSNFFYNGTNNIYLNNNTATAYGQSSGQHLWFIAPSGTAGNAITFTQAMTLFATGNLAIGTTSDAGFRLDVNGTVRFTGYTFDVPVSTVTRQTITNSTVNLRIESDSGNGVAAIGTVGSHALHLRTNNADRIVVSSTGASAFTSSVTSIANGDYSANFTKTYTPSALTSNINSYGTVSNLTYVLTSASYTGSETYNAAASLAQASISGNATTKATQPFRAYQAGLLGRSASAAMNIADFRFFDVKAPDANGVTGHVVDNMYGLKIAELKGASNFTVTTGWGVYQEGANDKNYFAGSMDLGSTLYVGGSTAIGRIVDSGVKLFIRGSGTSTSTYGLVIQDSSANTNFFVFDNGNSYVRGSLGVGANIPHASAKMEVNSDTQGFLPPRMTTTQRNAISSPASGLIVYDITTNKHYGYDGTSWNAFY